MYWYNLEKTKKIQAQLIKSLLDLKPTHFLTIQFPIHYRKSDFQRSQETLRQIMKRIEKQLVGYRWYNKPVPFIAFAEHSNKKGIGWHYHLLIYDCKYTTKQIKGALDQTCTIQGLPDYTFKLEQIKSQPAKVCSYCVKSIKSDISGRFDTGMIIPHNILFDLDVNKQAKITPETTKTQPATSNKPKKKALFHTRLFKKVALVPMFLGFLYFRIVLFNLRSPPVIAYS